MTFDILLSYLAFNQKTFDIKFKGNLYGNVKITNIDFTNSSTFNFSLSNSTQIAIPKTDIRKIYFPLEHPIECSSVKVFQDTLKRLEDLKFENFNITLFDTSNQSFVEFTSIPI